MGYKVTSHTSFILWRFTLHIAETTSLQLLFSYWF
jgi:hypothetical protein